MATAASSRRVALCGGRGGGLGVDPYCNKAVESPTGFGTAVAMRSIALLTGSPSRDDTRTSEVNIGVPDHSKLEPDRPVPQDHAAVTGLNRVRGVNRDIERLCASDPSLPRWVGTTVAQPAVVKETASRCQLYA